MTSTGGPNFSLYPKVNIFGEKGIPLPNILSTSTNLEEAFELGKGDDILFPLSLERDSGNNLVIKNSTWLFHDDIHYNEITQYFDALKDSVFSPDTNNYKAVPLGYSHILNLPNTQEEVTLRQNGIKELVKNESLFHAIEELFQSLETYISNSHQWGNIDYSATLDPIQAKELLGKLGKLSGSNPDSQVFQNIIDWAQSISTDSYFQHLVTDKRKVDEHCLLSFYSDRFEKRVWATIKQGVKLEDFCDIIPKSGESYTDTIGKGSRKKNIIRHVIKTDSPLDEGKDNVPFARARQRIDHIKEIASGSLSIPLFLLLIQLKHLYLGALMYKDLEEKGFPVCFPEISDEKFDLDFTDLFPIGEIFTGQKTKNELTSNSLTFTPEEKLIHIKGANDSGKSELFRSIHFSTMLVNAGFPVPAKSYKAGIVPSSKFILFQGNNHNGSQLKNAKHHVFKELEDVFPGTLVILDELGDATNSPTAHEVGKRIIDPLLESNCRIFITSHHDALDKIIQENGGVSLSPTQSVKGKERYKILRNSGDVSYDAEEVLDRIGITEKAVGKIIGKQKRTSPKRKDIQEKDYDNAPF